MKAQRKAQMEALERAKAAAAASSYRPGGGDGDEDVNEDDDDMPPLEEVGPEPAYLHHSPSLLLRANKV